MASEKIYWKALDGTVVELTEGSKYIPMAKRSGFWQVKHEFSEVDVPGQAGRKLIGVRVKERDIDLTVMVQDNSPTLLRTRVRALDKALLTEKGNGQLIVEDELGERRILSCQYQSGVEKAEEGHNYLEFVLNFRAHDPYWYAENSISTSFASSESTTSWFPFFPIKLMSSSVFGEATIDNAGDVEAWPVITIQGPGANISIDNLKSGASMKFKSSMVLYEGDNLVIDTRPGKKSAKKNGADSFRYLSATSEFFPLDVGETDIRVRMTDADDEHSLISVELTPRHASP